MGRTFCIMDVFWKDVLCEDFSKEGRFVEEDVMWRDVLYCTVLTSVFNT